MRFIKLTRAGGIEHTFYLNVDHVQEIEAAGVGITNIKSIDAKTNFIAVKETPEQIVALIGKA